MSAEESRSGLEVVAPGQTVKTCVVEVGLRAVCQWLGDIESPISQNLFKENVNRKQTNKESASKGRRRLMM